MRKRRIDNQTIYTIIFKLYKDFAPRAVAGNRSPLKRRTHESRVINTMVEVKITDKNGFEKAMRQFKKQCQKDGFLVELKERRFYSKPSDRKRKKGNGGR